MTDARHSSSKPSFTAKQGQYVAFIYAYTCIMRRPPAEADMRRHFQVTPPTVHQMVLTLEQAGLIQRQPGPQGASNSSLLPKTSPSYDEPPVFLHPINPSGLGSLLQASK